MWLGVYRPDMHAWDGAEQPTSERPHSHTLLPFRPDFTFPSTFWDNDDQHYRSYAAAVRSYQQRYFNRPFIQTPRNNEWPEFCALVQKPRSTLNIVVRTASHLFSTAFPVALRIPAAI